MTLFDYTAQRLFDWLIDRGDFLLLDVRNEVEFSRFKVEGPHAFNMINVPYMEFIEHEEESVSKVPTGEKIRIVCAKEGSAKYVGEILIGSGFQDVGYLQGGIKTWGNLLAPIEITNQSGYALYQFRRPGKASCSHSLVVGDEMMVFDPAKNIDGYQDLAKRKQASIIKTFETHRQADYISGSPALGRTAGAQIIAPDADFEGARFDYTAAKDGDIHSFASRGPEVRVISTPGHTPGSTCYLIDGKYLITGDTVFIQSCGRPDLGGKAIEWSKLLFDTIQTKIKTMDGAILALPGHYMDWSEANHSLIFMESLERIKARNSEIYDIEDEQAFIEFIQANIRPQPEEYARIREINAGFEEPDEEEQDILDLGKNECAASAMTAKSR
jgi:glyoxylase-like metal-dependent hydrolase (beta-lactamase superfamily II)